MMTTKGLNLFLLLITLFLLCNAQNPTPPDIYVSKYANSPQDGSFDSPYKSLTDAFDFIQRDTSNTKEYIINIAPAAETYELTKSYKFELQTLPYKITVKKWINATLPEGQPDDLPKVNFTTTSLQLINISRVRFESLNMIGDQGSILLNSTELQLNNLVFEEKFGTNVDAFITVNNARVVEMNKLDITVTFYNTLVRYLVTDENLDPLIVMNKIHYTIDTRVIDFKGDQSLFEFQSIRTSKVMAFKGSVEIEDFRFDIIDDGRMFILENILSVQGFGGVHIGKFNMEDNTLKAFMNRTTIALSKINYVTISKVNVRNNTFIQIAIYPIFLLEAVNFVGINNLNFSSNQISLLGGNSGNILFELRKIGQIDIANHVVANNTFQHAAVNILAMLPSRNGVTEDDLGLIMKNVTFINNLALSSRAPVTFLKCDGPILHSWELENFTVSQNSVGGRLLDFHTYSTNSKYSSDMNIPPPPERFLKRVRIVNNPNLSDFSFIYFAPSPYLSDSDECILFAAQDKLTFYDLEIVNNSFSKGNSSIWAYEPGLLQVKQSSVGFINLTMQNNTFDTYNFLSLDHKPSSFILNASSITDTTFTSCQFLASNYLKGYTCATIGANILTLPTLLYRFAFILDSVFSKVQLNSSDFIDLNNGFVSVKNTTFKDLDIQDSSTLISNKFYSLPLLPHKTAYVRDPSFEAPIFKGFPELWGAFNETLDRVDPEAAYFCSFYENRFENIFLANSSLISLEKFQLKPTFIEIAKNQFSEITASHDSTLVDLINFWDLRVTQNSFVHLNGKIKAISISPHGGSKALTMSNNKLQFAEILSFLSYTGKTIKELKFDQNEFLDSHYRLGGIAMDVDTAAGDWVIENNHFENNTMEFEGGSLESSAFFLIRTKSAQPSNKITLQNNIFNLLDVSIGFLGFQGSLVSAISINTFQNVYFKKNSILESFALVSGGLMEINVPKAGFYIEDSEFRDILTYYSKSMITFTASQFSVNNSNFIQMESQGETGLFSQIATSLSSSVQILNSKFDKIFSNFYGALLTSRSSSISRTNQPEFDINLQIDNCSMTNFENQEVLYFQNLICSSCVLKNSLLQMYQLRENSILKNSFFFEKVQGSLDLNNVQFALPRSAPVSLIQVINSTQFVVTLQNIHYNGLISQNKCTLLNLITLDSGTFAVQNSLFENIFLDKFPLINVAPNANSPPLQDNQPTISFSNASFNKISYNGDEGVPNDVYHSNALVYDYSIGAKPQIKSLIFSALPTFYKIKNSTFSEMTQLSVLVLGHFENLIAPRYKSIVDISTSIFQNNSAVLGPAITVLPKSYTPAITIFNSVFELNDAQTTGTLTIYNSKLILRNSFFKKNTANIGPAVFMGTKTGQTYSFSNNTYEDNLSFYTQDIRFEVVDFRIDFIPPKSSRITPSSTLEGNASLVLMNVSDYEMQQGMLQLTFLDAYGNPTPDFSISRQASFDLPMNVKSKSQVLFNAYMEDCHAETCYLTLHNLLMTGFVEQNISLNVKFTSETIDQYKSIQLNFRPCVAGEHQNGDTCTPCIAPTFSIDPIQPCTNCPSNADCPDQSKICPRPGFWNPSPLSTNIMECRDDEIFRCSHENGCGTCAKGYAGPFCETCDFKNSYIETGYLKCGLCENPSKSLMYSIGFSIFYSIYQIVSIYIVYSGNKKLLDDDDLDHTLEKQKVARSFYMKVFLTYTQLMSVLYMGTSSVLKSLGVTSQIGNPAALVTYGTQCSMQALNIDYRDFFYYQTYIIITSPFTQLVIVLFGFTIAKVFSRSIRVREIGVVAFLYLIISFQPGIVANLAQFLTCRKVEGVERPFVASHAYWTCDHPMYVSISKYIAIPSLLLWCFIVPLIIFAILFFKRHKLQTQEMTSLVGFFMKDVKAQHYYWGVFLMLMKLSLSFFIYSGNKDAEIQICISLLIIWGYQALLRSKKPYKEDAFNQLEILLMNLLMFNVIAVKYLINPNNGELVSKTSIAVVLALNGGFISFMGYKILPLTFLAIKNLFFKPAKTESKQSLLGSSKEDHNDTLQL